ncbi:MFS transporter [Nocardioides eburneiflavus]|uniref:MFS transporter n=1 Tax=Nocardioides eburneiflavus TaxID=2518372 RepID=UPI00143CD76B|nr:MFS transporter [Nocardioides eburneiflavus]
MLTRAAASSTTTGEPHCQQKARGPAIWGAIGCLGIAVGVALGGVLTTWTSWEAIFWINVPIGVLVIAATLQVVAKDHKGPASLAQFDVPGAWSASDHSPP